MRKNQEPQDSLNTSQSDNRGLSRRTIVLGGGAALASLGCGRTSLLSFPGDPLDPDEDDMATNRQCAPDDDSGEPAEDASSPYYNSMVLFATATVAPGAASGPNVASLQNPHGLPMEIYEIRFRVYPKNTSAGTFSYLSGLSIGVKLDLGAIAITDSKVPVSGFSCSRDATQIGQGGAQFVAGTTVGSQSTVYSWRLKYPLLVPAGAVLTPVFEHLGQNPFDVNVDVVYFVRTLAPNYQAPSKVMVPWVVAFNSQSYANQLNAPAGTELSPDDDLVNNFGVPLEITRLVGGVTLSTTDQNGINSAIEDGEDHRFRLGRISIRGSRGDEIARTPTIFNTLFPTDWLAWDIPGSWIMRPGEFYKVNLTVGAVNYTPATSGENPGQGRVQYSITAVGFRPIDTQKLLADSRGGRA